MANSEKEARRRRLGDKPAMEIPAARPIPGLPQNQKGGNSDNYPFIDINGQMGQMIGKGPSSPYGDYNMVGHPSLSTPTIANPSGRPQALTANGKNPPYGSIKSPDDQTAAMMMANNPSTLTLQGTPNVGGLNTTTGKRSTKKSA